MTQLEEYNAHIGSDGYSDLKEKVNKIIADKNLTSYMNDTKWLELQNAIADLPFPPPYSLKLVIDYHISNEPTQLSYAPQYIGDWSSYWNEGLPPFFNIEWIKVCPRYGKFRGRIINDEILDETEEFITILKKYNIPYEKDKENFIIYGYK